MFVRTTWNVIVPRGVGTRTTPLIVVVPLPNLIILLLAVNVSSWIVGSFFCNTRTCGSLAKEIPAALLSSIMP